MATSNGLEEFAERMNKVADQVESRFSRLLRGAALAAAQAAILATPVDTGRARGGWSVAVNRDPTPGDFPPDLTGSLAIGRAVSVLGVPSGKIDFINVVNAVEYIDFLENGSSKQAPAGMTPSAILAAQSYLRANGRKIYPER